MREGGGIPVDCAQSNFSSYVLHVGRGLMKLYKF